MFSAPMVQALLGGRKTQTRRLATSPLRRVQAGDRLWVRETFATTNDLAMSTNDVIWRADEGNADWPHGWRPAIHMPRWASRLTLQVEAVRVEPLHALTDSDAEAEGVVWESADPPFYYVPGIWPHSITGVEISDGAAASYRKLWEYLHGGASWQANPDVLVLSFQKVEA